MWIHVHTAVVACCHGNIAHLFSYQSVVACAPDLQLPVCSKITVASPAMREKERERGRGGERSLLHTQTHTHTYTHACIPLVSSPDPTIS